MSDMGMQLMFNLFTFPRPTISVLTGHTIAMGLFMSTSTDYRIGLDDKFIVQANEVRIGMDIPTSIMELVASRITKDHAYRLADGIMALRELIGLEVLPENPPGHVYLGDLHLLDFFHLELDGEVYQVSEDQFLKQPLFLKLISL